MIETEFVDFGIEKACVVTRNYIPCTVVISTTLTLLSVCSVTNSMCHSYHSPFHGSRSSNFDFLANVCKKLNVLRSKQNYIHDGIV